MPTEVDPWLDTEGFGGIDFRPAPPELIDDGLETIPPDLDPQVITNVVHEPVVEPEPIVAPVATIPDPDEPQLIENEDGTFIQIEKGPKGWKATLDSSAIGGRKEVFYGKTKSEMYTNIATGKMNATKELNKLNRKIKLGDGETPTVAETVVRAEQETGKKLTADQIFELKTLMETNPDEAFETWFNKRTGRSIDEFGRIAEDSLEGKTAALDLKMETAARGFIAQNPDYYADAGYENYTMLLGYLTKSKLHKVLTAKNQEALAYELTSKGHYTVSNLEEAFQELSEDGLLLTAPKTPKRIPEQQPPQQQERIVRTETRPRAGLGIRLGETSVAPASSNTPPSAEDYDKLSNEEIDKLIALERNKVLRSRR